MQANEQIRTQADAAKAARAETRRRTIRRVTVSSLALFGVVFALLSYRLTAGLDPSSPTDSAQASNTSSSTEAVPSDDDQEDTYESDGEDDWSSSSGTSTSPQQPSTVSPQPSTSAPSTGAS